MARRLFTVAVLAALDCSDSTSSARSLPLTHIDELAAALDTIDAGVSTPQLRSMSALALPMHAAGLDFRHLDSSVLGKTVEWNALQRAVFLTTRPATPSNVLRVTLYELDNSGLPAPSKVEVGYAYVEWLNEFTGGRPDSAYMRFTLFDMRQPFSAVVGAWDVWRLPADTACGQCATIHAEMNPTAPGGQFIGLIIPYRIPLGGDGAFSGASIGYVGFVQNATLPGPAATAATTGWAFSWYGDSVRTTSGPLHPSAGELIGGADVTINGQPVAGVSRTASGFVAADKDGHVITNQTDAHVLAGLFAVPADIADYIEWPTFVIFYCGC
ncbi:MAG TPA: hypothetical protein VF864_01125 [Gemmatimonadales bacterium]